MAKLCWLVSWDVVQLLYRVIYTAGGIKLKKCFKFFSLVLVLTIIFGNFAFASSFENYQEVESVQTEEIVGKIEDGVGQAADTVNSLAYTVIEQISDKSLPVCGLLILWGAILYFILGIRNLYKKRQGMLLMWGSFTFLVVAKIAYFLVWFFTMV